MLNQETILNALKSVKYPGFSRDIVSFGLIKDLQVDGGTVRVRLQLTSPNPDAAAQLKQDCEQTLSALPEVKAVHIDVQLPAVPGAGPARGRTRPKCPASGAWSPWPAARAASASPPWR
jgi:ATP-binding protein involved in chromosome partitioning